MQRMTKKHWRTGVLFLAVLCLTMACSVNARAEVNESYSEMGDSEE